jgi:DNA polymerase-3 subunit delta'
MDLIGNSQVTGFLQRVIAAGRLPGSFLFAGPEGIGKKQFAVELAKSILCAETDSFGSCGKCSVCMRAGEFTFPTSEKKDDYERVFFSGHADVGMIIPYGRNISVGAIRELEREANFRPYEGKLRFFIIDDAEKMNLSAANALLKTLEEPPATTHIILLTSRYNSLLQTIISRCQIVRFQPIAAADIEQFLLKTKEFSPEDAMLAAKISQGSLSRALSMGGENFRHQRDLMLNVLTAATFESNRVRLLKAAEEMGDAKAKDDYEPRLDILQSLIHDTWLLKKDAPLASLTNADLHTQLLGCAGHTTAETLVEWLNAIEKVRADLLVNINRKIATDALFMSAAS